MGAEAPGGYFGLCRRCGLTEVPSLRTWPLTFTVIGPRRGGVSEHLPLGITITSFAPLQRSDVPGLSAPNTD